MTEALVHELDLALERLDALIAPAMVVKKTAEDTHFAVAAKLQELNCQYEILSQARDLVIKNMTAPAVKLEGGDGR